MNLWGRGQACASILWVLAGNGVYAQSDEGLDRIPSVPDMQGDTATAPGRNLYWQSDLTYNSPRRDLTVPLSPPPAWEARGFLDMRLDQHIDANFSAAYSGRFNLRAAEGLGFPNRENVRNDLREVYAAWTDNRGWFLQFGRINLKSGVAEGFNPTDYFKTRAVVEPTSIDPAVLREDRLGVVMLESQWIGSTGSLTLALAPKLARDSPPYAGDALPSFNPMFDRTNAGVRALIKGSIAASNGISPEILIYEEAGSTRVGFNLSKGFGRAVVAYLEWSGGRRASLADEAYEEGRRTAVLPPAPPMPVDDARKFSSDLAAGLSYTTRAGISLAMEFDYHQAGFSNRDWRDWFAAGNRATVGRPAAPLAGELWFIRGFAGEQQEPTSRAGLFSRVYWQNAFVKNLTLSGFILADFRGSILAQTSADYYLSPRWTVGAIVDAFAGARHSDFGSLPQRGSALVKLTRYF
jgi:hypothetical protein